MNSVGRGVWRRSGALAYCGHHSRPQAPVPYLRPATADFRPDHANPVSALHRRGSPASCVRRAGWARRAFQAPVGECAGAVGHRRFRALEAGGRVFRALERLGARWRSFAEYRAATGTGRAAGSVGGASRGGLGSGSPHWRGVNPNAGKKAAAQATFAAGDAVDHKTFGRGTVVKVDGDTLHVKFAKTGQTKKLLKDYAPIVKIG
ncbi:MAG: hypothetical protein ACLTDR_15155 [Adlercreutzia equolifaciens]